MRLAERFSSVYSNPPYPSRSHIKLLFLCVCTGRPIQLYNTNSSRQKQPKRYMQQILMAATILVQQYSEANIMFPESVLYSLLKATIKSANNWAPSTLRHEEHYARWSFGLLIFEHHCHSDINSLQILIQPAQLANKPLTLWDCEHKSRSIKG